MLSTPNVSKHASIRLGNDPWEKSPGAVSAGSGDSGSGDTGSGDRIRTCDLEFCCRVGGGVGKPDCRHRCSQNFRQLTVRNNGTLTASSYPAILR